MKSEAKFISFERCAIRRDRDLPDTLGESSDDFAIAQGSRADVQKRARVGYIYSRR